jgi:hypothetical protein
MYYLICSTYQRGTDFKRKLTTETGVNPAVIGINIIETSNKRFHGFLLTVTHYWF